MDKSKLMKLIGRHGLEPGPIEAEPGPSSSGESRIHLTPEFFVRLAEETWRLEQRIDRLQRSSGGDLTQGLADSARRLGRLLSELEIAFEDHTGSPYSPGQGLDVAQVEGEVTSSSILWVSQTIKPTVSFQGRVLRAGQVVLSAEPQTHAEKTGEQPE